MTAPADPPSGRALSDEQIAEIRAAHDGCIASGDDLCDALRLLGHIDALTYERDAAQEALAASRAREQALERENLELACYASGLVCDLSSAANAATEYRPRKNPRTQVCRWCGMQAPLHGSIKHEDRCPFVRPRRCVSVMGHVWRLATDRGRDGIGGTGGTWDLQYTCDREHCSGMEFCFYGEREAFEASRIIGEPWLPMRERRPDLFALAAARPDEPTGEEGSG